jgi:Glycosyl transferases group 1/Glycosyltransferase Family 4
MNVLYLTYDGLTDPLGQSQVLPYIIGLRKRELNFTIISFEKPLAFQEQKKGINEIVSQNNIQWRPLKYTKKPPFISTLYDIYKFKKQVSKEIENISLTHCRSYISALVGLWAKKKYNVPFIFDMRGFWADERKDAEIWNINNWIHKRAYNYFKRKEKEFLQESAYTVSLTYSGKKEIETWQLKHLSSIEVIPCCTDENLFNLNNVKNIRQDLGLSSNEFVLSYLGSIGTWYMLDEMLDFFKVLLSKKEEAKFLFITKDDENFIKDSARKKNISIDKIIVKSANRKDVPSYIKVSDASIFFIKSYYSKKASSPTKMGEIMNLGVPIICNSGVGDVDVIMEKVMPQLLVNDFNDSEYDRVVWELLENRKTLNKDKIKEMSLNYFSLEDGVAKFYQTYQSILKLK